MKRLLSIVGASLMATAVAVPVQAAAGAKFVLRSGEHVSGELVDFNARGLSARVGGQSRTWTIGQVAVIDFTGAGTFPANEVEQAGGEHLLVLTNGQLLRGRLVDVGGSSPLRITFAQGGSNREFRSNEVARIYFARPVIGATTLPGTCTSAAGLAPASGRVRVAGTAGWVNTGLVVSQGQTLLFNTTGEVRLSAATDDVAGPAGSKRGRHAPGSPVPSVLAGALVGRIGNGVPFAIGNQVSIPSPGAGMLWLAVNDDSLGDNAGEFGVDVSAQTRPRR
jgi:hypothetical protein